VIEPVHSPTSAMPVFDGHFHVIDRRFPLVANEGYLPDEFTVADYRTATRGLGITGGAVVSGSFQAFDQSYLLASLRELGPAYVGVTQLPADVSDDEVLGLARAGVRAVRFNLRRGGSARVAELEHFAVRVHALAGWHVELYADAAELSGIGGLLTSLPAVVIDHLGLTKAGFPLLLSLVEGGCWAKASGFGRIDFDPASALAELAAVAPERLLFGTDLPSTRAPRPFDRRDLRLVVDALGAEIGRKVLHDNAIRLYRPG
jgi:predicted TIM-barrel fold metal-dependent hydrolase